MIPIAVESPGWHIRLEGFDGPLDLLLRLIEQQQLNIYDIPIALVADQYLSYLDNDVIDLDQASGFLVMAATLLQLKARMLLPPIEPVPDEPEDEDPRLELVSMLVEYRRVKQAAAELSLLADRFGQTFRGTPRPETGDLAATATVTLPAGTGGAAFDAAARRVVRLLRGGPAVTARDPFQVVRKIRELLRVIRRASGTVRLFDLVGAHARTEMVATFLALLELVRLRRAVASQDRTWGDIMIAHVPKRRSGGGSGD